MNAFAAGSGVDFNIIWYKAQRLQHAFFDIYTGVGAVFESIVILDTLLDMLALQRKERYVRYKSFLYQC